MRSNITLSLVSDLGDSVVTTKEKLVKMVEHYRTVCEWQLGNAVGNELLTNSLRYRLKQIDELLQEAKNEN